MKMSKTPPNIVNSQTQSAMIMSNNNKGQSHANVMDSSGRVHNNTIDTSGRIHGHVQNIVDSATPVHNNTIDTSGRAHGHVQSNIMCHSGRMHTNITEQQSQQNTYTGYSSQASENTGNVKQCAGCGLNIIDRFLLHALDKFWHTACLKCSCCQAQLGDIGTTCFTRNAMILCKNDYLRLFGNPGRCTGCNQPIPAQEMVMKAQTNVYHVNCFCCVICHCQLMRGDRYSLYQGRLLCEHDLPKVIRGSIQVPPVRTLHKVC